MARRKNKSSTSAAKRKRKLGAEKFEAARSSDAWKSKTLPRADRNKLIALTMASLVCGLLFVINCDRVTHADDVGFGESRHGWPLVYLKRDLKDQPMLYLTNRTYSWPWPAVENETRDLNLQNLAINIVVSLGIASLVYWGFRTVVGVYDRWKFQPKKQSD